MHARRVGRAVGRAVLFKGIARFPRVAAALHLAGIGALAHVRARMQPQMVPASRREAAALHITGKQARVRERVPPQVRAICSRIAAALHHAGMGELASVLARVPRHVGAICSRVTAALHLAGARFLESVHARVVHSSLGMSEMREMRDSRFDKFTGGVPNTTRFDTRLSDVRTYQSITSQIVCYLSIHHITYTYHFVLQVLKIPRTTPNVD